MLTFILMQTSNYKRLWFHHWSNKHTLPKSLIHSTVFHQKSHLLILTVVKHTLLVIHCYTTCWTCKSFWNKFLTKWKHLSNEFKKRPCAKSSGLDCSARTVAIKIWIIWNFECRPLCQKTEQKKKQRPGSERYYKCVLWALQYDVVNIILLWMLLIRSTCWCAECAKPTDGVWIIRLMLQQECRPLVVYHLSGPHF